MENKDIRLLISDRFIPNLYYASENNIARENLYSKFNITDEILVHKNLYDRLVSLIPVLVELNLKLIISDAFRPLEIQNYLYDNWEKLTGQKAQQSLAPAERAPHPRCIAIDAVLANEQGERILQPSSSTKFNPEERIPDYVFSDTPENKEKEYNRNLLRILMVSAGISPINKEWFHFQLPNTELYPIITIDDARNLNKNNTLNIELSTNYYDVPFNYWKHEHASKKGFWIFDKNYFTGLPVIGFQEFIRRLRK
jgi:D-alanyl-D-alanine dipeptidase